MDAVEELGHLLRPAGGGLYLVSTGRAEQLALQRRLYGAASEAEVDARFRETLGRIQSARAVILGVPSDVGAGFQRGSNLGPQAIRLALLAQTPDWPERLQRAGVLDLGDVFVVPQLLHDEMLSAAQLSRSRKALYPQLSDAQRDRLPVSPLSIGERVLDLVFQINPQVKPFVLGGDHSNAWPVAAALSRVRTERWGIVQPDAHTDLLAERLGVTYCFATWSYHANELLGRGGRLVQVGTRASRYGRAHWEQALGVRQFWASEVRQDPQAALDQILAHLKAVGVEGVYFSNDIDGTDEAEADATGTPEPEGVDSAFFLELIARLGREVGLIAGDLMEVAPGVHRSPDGAKRTLELSATYVRATLSAMLGQPL